MKQKKRRLQVSVINEIDLIPVTLLFEFGLKFDVGFESESNGFSD